MRAAIEFSREIDEEAKKADPGDLIAINMPMAMRLARWYYNKIHFIPLEDLQGEALLALVEAARRRGNEMNPEDFEKYALSWIVGKLKQTYLKKIAYTHTWGQSNGRFKIERC